ncbi:MAG: thermonuclease family protein [Neisseria sp.]|nr:thermonuclease family protein [Neisseria sp.]
MFSMKNIWLWAVALLGLFGLMPAESSGLKEVIRTAEQVLNLDKNPSRTAAPAAKQYRGRVVSVADGDTVRIADTDGRKHKIRLAYIDAPESNQAHGAASREALSRLVMQKNVEVRVFESDQYGREVAQITLNGRDINLSQIQNGHAWHYVSIAKKKQNKNAFGDYAAAESQARRSRAGLWQNSSPTPPWTFRKQQRGQ